MEAADGDSRTEVESTKELCHEIGEANTKILKDGPMRCTFQRNGNLEVGSLDVKNFYPSIDVNLAAEEVKLEVMESEAEVAGVDYEEAALFLACTMTEEELSREGLTHVVHKRKNKNGRRSGVTCKAMSEGPVGQVLAATIWPTTLQAETKNGSMCHQGSDQASDV